MPYQPQNSLVSTNVVKAINILNYTLLRELFYQQINYNLHLICIIQYNYSNKYLIILPVL